MVKRRTTLLFSAATAIGVVPAAAACGISTHNEVCHRASWWFDAPDYPEYRQYIQDNPEAVQGGASFPDWGYALEGYGDAGEEAHWDPFLQAVADYIHVTYPRPWDQETQRLLAFMFAVSAHSASDISWHGLGVDEGFIDVLSAQDFGGDWSAAHTAADTGGDMVTAYEIDQTYLTSPWYVPIDDMVAVYHELGYDYVNRQAMIFANFLLFVGGHAEKVAGQLLYPYAVQESPTLAEQMQDYFVGGVDDMSAFSAWKYLEVIDWIENGAPGAARTSVDWYQHEEAPHASIDLGLELIDAGIMKVTIDPTPRGVMYRLHVTGGEPTDTTQPGTDRRSPLVPPPSSAALNDGVSTDVASRWVAARTTASPLVFTPTLTYTLDSPYAYLGTSVVTGDFNRDGNGDLAMGAPGYGAPGQPQRGAVFVAYGSENPSEGQLELSQTGANAVLESDDDYGRFGWSMAVVDLNADGLDDLAVSAPTLESRDLYYHGQVSVFLGDPDNGLSRSPDIVLTSDETYTNLGYTLESGDCNADGAADLLIGAPFARAGGTQRGLVAIYLSSASRLAGTDLTLEEADWSTTGENDFDWFGMHIAVGQLKDGGPLLLVGAPTFDDGDRASVGRLYAYDLTGIGQSTDAPHAQFTLTGVDQFAQTGGGFAFGDPMGVGSPLLVLASPSEYQGPLVQSGTVMAGLLDDLEGDLTLDDVSPISTLLGSQNFEHFGWEVRMTDNDHDGRDELWVAAPWRRTAAGVEAGAVYVWTGGELPSGTHYRGENTSSLSLEGQVVAGRLGNALAFPDFNGDGLLDVAVAARQDSSVATQSGVVSVLLASVAGKEFSGVWQGIASPPEQPPARGRMRAEPGLRITSVR